MFHYNEKDRMMITGSAVAANVSAHHAPVFLRLRQNGTRDNQRQHAEEPPPTRPVIGLSINMPSPP